MNKINLGRVILGGLVAGLIVNLFEDVLNGMVLASSGETDRLDSTSLASLVAGEIAATGGLAKLIGEKDFSVLFHEGVKDNLHISLVAGRVILVVIFDKRSSLGLVRLIAGSFLDELESPSPDQIAIGTALDQARATHYQDLKPLYEIVDLQTGASLASGLAWSADGDTILGSSDHRSKTRSGIGVERCGNPGRAGAVWSGRDRAAGAACAGDRGDGAAGAWRADHGDRVDQGPESDVLRRGGLDLARTGLDRRDRT